MEIIQKQIDNVKQIHTNLKIISDYVKVVYESMESAIWADDNKQTNGDVLNSSPHVEENITESSSDDVVDSVSNEETHLGKYIV